MKFFGNKKGFSMVELLVVVSIMGILVSVGVVGFKSMVTNSRVKGAAQDTAAFMNRVATLSNKVSDTVTVIMDNSKQKLIATHVSWSGKSSVTDRLDSFMLEGQLKFDCPKAVTDNALKGWTMPANGVKFYPKFGLSAAPKKGVLCIVLNDVYGIAIKNEDDNKIRAKWRSGTSGAWSDL